MLTARLPQPASVSQPAAASPGLLAALLAERVAWATGRSDGELDLEAADTTVLVVLRSLDLADLVHGAREFAAGLEPAAAADWRRSWTRTRFLFGNPANLGASSPPRVVAPGGTTAWLGPFPQDHLPGPSRLLKPVSGDLPELPADLDLPGLDLPGSGLSGSGLSGSGRPGGPCRVLTIATGGLGLVDYLVHLHHTLAEAVLLGRLRPDEPVRLSHRPVLGADQTRVPPAYARVLPEPDDPDQLRPHTWLSPG